MDSNPDQGVDRLAPGDDQQPFMDKFHELLALGRDSGITLTNIYKEMPITHPASLCEVKSRVVELETCELQLAAISQCNEVYIQAPQVEAPVLAQLQSFDIRRRTVLLSNFSYRELFVNRRGALRVRFRRPINVVARSGPNVISGVIHDISLAGCCINTLVKSGFQDGELQVELKLVGPVTGEELIMQIPASLLRISEPGPPYKCVLHFNHNQHSEDLLSVFINQRQHEILKELRESL